MPKVSIILPTHNGSKYIKNAITSVVQQTCTDWELLIINDGSTDDTVKIVEEYCHSDSRIKLFTNEKNLGLPRTLNKGLSLASAELVARIDDDDVWIDKDKLNLQIHYFDAHPEYVLVGTWFRTIDTDGQEVRLLKLPETDKELRNTILSYNPFGHSTVMFKKAVALSCGSYDITPETLYMEDYDLWTKMGLKGKLANLNTVSTNYLVRDGLAKKNPKWKFLRFRTQIFFKYFFNYGGRVKALTRLVGHALFY